MRDGYGSRLKAQRHLEPRRSPGRRPNRFRRRPRSAQEQNDECGFMTPAFYRARLWPKSVKDLGKSWGGRRWPRKENLPHANDAAAKRPPYT